MEMNIFEVYLSKHMSTHIVGSAKAGYYFGK